MGIQMPLSIGWGFAQFQIVKEVKLDENLRSYATLEKSGRGTFGVCVFRLSSDMH